MKRKRALAAIAAAAVLATSIAPVPVFAEETTQEQASSTEATSSNTKGVSSYGKDQPEKVSGDITTKGSSFGAYATNGGEVTVDGNISTEHVGVDIFNSEITNEKGETNKNTDKSSVSVSGDVRADRPKDQSADMADDRLEYATGIQIYNGGGEAEVTVGGDITAQTESADLKNGTVTYGIDSATVDESAKNTISVGGNVTAEGIGLASASGVSARNSITSTSKISQGGDHDISVEGDVSATGTWVYGISSFNYSHDEEDSKIDITVGGSVSATGQEAKGIQDATAVGNSTSISVKGSVTAKEINADETQSTGILTWNAGGQAKIETGSVTADSTGIQIGKDEYYDPATSEKASTSIAVNGDVTGGDYGIVYDNANPSEVNVSGTVSGKEAAITVDAKRAEKLPEKNTLTVWKLESESGDLIKAYDYKYDEKTHTSTKTEAKDPKLTDNIYKSVDYIIRTDKTNNGTLTLSGADKNDKYGLTAKEQTKLTVNVKAADGYTVDSVKGGSASLTKNADGTYTLVVPRGGGVQVSALIKAIEKVQDTGKSSNDNTPSGSSNAAPASSQPVSVAVETVSVPAQTRSAGIIPKDSSDIALPDTEVTGNYAEVASDAVATITKAEQTDATEAAAGTTLTGAAAQAAALTAYTDAAYPAAQKVYGPYKVQLFDKGVSIWDNFGTLKVNIKVDPAYNGRTATIAHLEKDGSVTTAQTTVANGQISADLTTAGTISVVIE